MDQIAYRVNYAEQTVSVSFDVRDEENSCHELEFGQNELLAVINMVDLNKAKVELASIGGFASLTGSKLGQGDVCFSYPAVGGYETVLFSYVRVREAFELAFDELMRSRPSND